MKTYCSSSQDKVHLGSVYPDGENPSKGLITKVLRLLRRLNISENHTNYRKKSH